MIALIPSLRDCRLRELEFLTFLRNRSSLKSLAFSTTSHYADHALTVGSLPGVMAACIKQVRVQLILEQISYGVGSHVVLLGHQRFLLLVGLVLEATLS